jgi:hypothetical protein
MGGKQIPIKRRSCRRESPKPWPGAREGREGRSRTQRGRGARGADAAHRLRTMWLASPRAQGLQGEHKKGVGSRKKERGCGTAAEGAPSGGGQVPSSPLKERKKEKKKKKGPTILNRKLRLQRGKYGQVEGGLRLAPAAGACNKWARESRATRGRRDRGPGRSVGGSEAGDHPAPLPAGS